MFSVFDFVHTLDERGFEPGQHAHPSHDSKSLQNQLSRADFTLAFAQDVEEHSYALIQQTLGLKNSRFVTRIVSVYWG